MTLTNYTVQSFATTEDLSGAQALGIDPIAILAQAFTFLILFAILKKFALGKIVTALENRRKTIEKGLGLTAELEKMKEEIGDQTASILADAHQKAETMLKDTKDEARTIVKNAEEQANKRADDILKSAEEHIVKQVSDAKKELKAEITELVAETTGAVLRDTSSLKRERSLVSTYLKEVAE